MTILIKTRIAPNNDKKFDLIDENIFCNRIENRISLDWTIVNIDGCSRLSDFCVNIDEIICNRQTSEAQRYFQLR